MRKKHGRNQVFLYLKRFISSSSFSTRLLICDWSNELWSAVRRGDLRTDGDLLSFENNTDLDYSTFKH